MQELHLAGRQVRRRKSRAAVRPCPRPGTYSPAAHITQLPIYPSQPHGPATRQSVQRRDIIFPPKYCSGNAPQTHPIPVARNRHSRRSLSKLAK